MKIMHEGIQLDGDRKVFLGKLKDGYSIVFHRPVEDIDLKFPPRGGEIKDNIVESKFSLSNEAIEALFHLYIKRLKEVRLVTNDHV